VGSGRWGGETDLSVKQVDQLTLVELVGPKLNEGTWLKKKKKKRWYQVWRCMTLISALEGKRQARVRGHPGLYSKF
jgi:hypothetical protein